jgi:hypothetical protein
MTKDQLLQQALEALGPAAPTCCGCVAEWEIAITAIKEALTQPEQEPYLGKAYRLANELRGHLAIAPLPKRKWVSTSDFDRADLWHQDPKIAMAALEQFLKLANT